MEENGSSKTSVATVLQISGDVALAAATSKSVAHLSASGVVQSKNQPVSNFPNSSRETLLGESKRWVRYIC